MRNVDGSYTLVLTFDRTVVAGTAAVASGVGTVSPVPTFSGNTATVQLSGVVDRQTITLELDNVVGVPGLTEKVFVAMSVLVGDVDQSGAVATEDINLIKSHISQPVTGATFKYDINATGVITGSDVNIDKAMYGGSLFPDFAFTGHYYHARSGLYLTLYRAYDPSLGKMVEPRSHRGRRRNQSI